jgi:ribonucleoside-triphosphate reductase
MPSRCKQKTEVWSRVCGFFRPVSQWNHGKKAEYADRVEFVIKEKKK